MNYQCEFCSAKATHQGTVRNPESHMDEVVLVCVYHTSRTHYGTTKEIGS